MLRMGIAAGASMTLVLVACGSSTVTTTGAHRPAPTDVVSPPADTPPPLPAAALRQPTLVSIHGGGTSFSCTSGHLGVASWDPGRGWPSNTADLYRGADVVVRAGAVSSQGFWQRDDGHLPGPNPLGMDWATFTVTTLHVETVYKGSVTGHWLQVIDAGADPASLSTCANRAYQRQGWPQPKAGSGLDYVFFLRSDGHGGLHEYEGPADRWPLIAGVVHPDHDLQASAWQSVPGTPMPLAKFVTTMQR